MSVDPYGERLTYEELGEIGVVQEINRQLLHPVGLAMARHPNGTLTIHKDEDPEGWHFDGFDLRPAAERFAALQAEWHARRQELLGYVVQPLLEGEW